jgi:predicted transcriptional regulator
MEDAPYELLRAARAALHISHVDLSQKAGVSKRSLVRIEACEPVTLETRRRVQRALEDLGVEFIPEQNTKGPGISIRKGLIK